MPAAEALFQNMSNMFANALILLKFMKDVVPFITTKTCSMNRFLHGCMPQLIFKYYGIFKVNRFSDVS